MTIKVMHVVGGLVTHGAELRVLELISESARSGDFEHHVLVLDRNQRELATEFEAAGARLHWAGSIYSSGIRLARVAQSANIDAVHSHVDLINGWVLAWAAVAGVPVRISHMRSERVSTRLRDGEARRDAVLRRSISRFATTHLGVSPSALDAGFDAARARSTDARVILSGIALDRLETTPTRLPGEVVIVHVGRDTPLKNRDHAASVLRACHVGGIDATLYFIGETTEQRESELRALADLPPEKMAFLGLRQDAPALVAASDVLLSTSRAEGLPGAILEAGLLGTPVVCSAIPSNEYLATLVGGIESVGLGAPLSVWADSIGSQLTRGRTAPRPLDVPETRSLFDASSAARRFEDMWKALVNG